MMIKSLLGRLGVMGCAAMLVALAASGCQTSSHKSVRTYEYNEDPSQGRRAAQPVETEEDESEWHMVAPGEMVVEPD